MQDNQMEKDLTKQNNGENALTEPNRTEPNRTENYCHWLTQSGERSSRQSESVKRQGCLSSVEGNGLQRPSQSRKKIYKEIIVLGGIGNNARQNRNNLRVIGMDGCIYTIPAHADKEQPLVVKRWKRK